MRELALVANCIHCDTYFMQVVAKLDTSQNLDEYYETIQKKWSGAKRIQFLNCPTCNELCFGDDYQQILNATEHPTTLSICYFIRFDESDDVFAFLQKNSTLPTSSTVHTDLHFKTSDILAWQDLFHETNEAQSSKLPSQNSTSSTSLKQKLKKEKQQKQLADKKRKEERDASFDAADFCPVYIDMRDNPEEVGSKVKPKWTLVSGVGPKKIELDGCPAGRIYKPSFNSLGLKCFDIKLMYHKKLEDVKKEKQSGKKNDKYKYSFEEMCHMVIDGLLAIQDEQELYSLIQTMLQKKPLFDHFEVVEKDLQSFIAMKPIQNDTSLL